MHEHCHLKPCEHKNLKYCSTCKVVYCIDCGKEFSEKNYTYFTYSSTSFDTYPCVTDGTTINQCNHL